MFANSFYTIVLAFIVVTISACATNPYERLDASPVKAVAIGQPEENVNDFSEILECVGRQVASYGSQNFVVGNDRIINETGVKDGIPESGRTLLQSAFAKLVENSNGKIVWMGYNSSTDSVVNREFAKDNSISNPKQMKYETVDFTIYGAITQFEKELQKANRDADLKVLDYAKIGHSDSAGLSVLATNLTLHSATHGYSASYKGIQSNNIISIKGTDSATGISLGSVQVGGFGFNVSLKKKEGVSAALMNLMQLGAIELTGKFYKEDFDYRDCLEPEKRIIINNQLGWKKKYTGTDTNISTQISKPKFILSPVKPDLKVGNPIELVAKSSDNGHLYCFYSMADGNMVRIFPNRYIQNNFMQATLPVRIPGNNKVTIIADYGVKESINCILSRVDIARIVSTNSSLTPNANLSFEKLKNKIEEHVSPETYSINTFNINP